MESVKKSINSMLTGLLVLQLIIAILSIFSGMSFMSKDLIGPAIFNFIVGGLLLISGVTLRLRLGIGYYLSSLLGLVVILSNLYSFFMGDGFDILSILLGLILVTVFFNKRIKEEIL